MTISPTMSVFVRARLLECALFAFGFILVAIVILIGGVG